MAKLTLEQKLKIYNKETKAIQHISLLMSMAFVDPAYNILFILSINMDLIFSDQNLISTIPQNLKNQQSKEFLLMASLLTQSQ